MHDGRSRTEPMSDHHPTPVHPSAKDQWVDTDATGDHDDLSGPHGGGDHGDADGHGDPAHGAEEMGLGPIDVTAWQATLATITAHKFYGPKGAGALYVRRGFKCTPLQVGGEHESGRRWAQLPAKPQITTDRQPVIKDGKLQYSKIIWFADRAVADRFSEAVIRTLDAYAPGWDR